MTYQDLRAAAVRSLAEHLETEEQGHMRITSLPYRIVEHRGASQREQLSLENLPPCSLLEEEEFEPLTDEELLMSAPGLRERYHAI